MAYSHLDNTINYMIVDAFKCCHGCPDCLYYSCYPCYSWSFVVMVVFLNLRAASGARTRDLRLGKPLLYQLSYCRETKRTKPSKPGSCGADNETRTRDPRITNALLYQLSHIGTQSYCDCKISKTFPYMQIKV